VNKKETAPITIIFNVMKVRLIYQSVSAFDPP
jgi:hypothetical protein